MEKAIFWLFLMVGGVGVVVNSFVDAFKEIKNQIPAFDNQNLELICLAPYLSSNSKDHNSNITKITKESCELNNGKLIHIPTFSNGESQSSIWGGPN